MRSTTIRFSRSFAISIPALLALVACDASPPVEPAPDGGPSPGDAGPVCAFTRCEPGHAETCDGTLEVECGAFAGECVDVVSEEGVPGRWCGCGTMAEGEGRCAPTPVICSDGLALPAACPAGTVCVDAPSFGCQCDDADDGTCPDSACVDDPDCATCTPACDGLSCGENGCGGSCGSCGLGQICDEGRCVASCTPDCAGRACGGDGCGGSCGTCTSPEVCDADVGECVIECIPDCSGRGQCDPDGCLGDCGPPCAAGLECGASGLLESECMCPEGSMLSHAIDGSAIDWSGRLVAVSVEIRAVHRPYGASAGRTLISETRPNGTIAIFGCEADVAIEMRREFVWDLGESRCRDTDWQPVPSGTVVLPNLTEPPAGCALGAP